MSPFIDIDKITGAFVLMYGREGVGKTYAHRGLPPDETLYINIDGSGVRVLKGTGMKVFVPADFWDLRDAVSNTDAKFIVFDTYSSYLDGLIWERKAAKGSGKDRKTGGFKTVQDYGEAAELAQLTIQELSNKAMEGHIVVVLAHETEIDFSGEVETYPILWRLSGQDSAREKFKVACQLALAQFDMVGRMFIADKEKRGISFMSGKNYITKNRLGWPVGVAADEWSSHLVKEAAGE